MAIDAQVSNWVMKYLYKAWHITEHMDSSNKVRIAVFGYGIQKCTDKFCFNEHHSFYQLHVIY